MASRRTSNQRSASSASDSSSLFYESQFYYNVPSSSKATSTNSSYSPPPTYTPLARREERAADPYRAISDDQRWLRRVRQQQQEARLQAQQQSRSGVQQPRRSFDSPRITLDTELSDDEDDDGVLEDEQQYVPVSLAMHRQSSNESRRSSRSRTMSGSSATSSIAFAAVPPSPQRATSTIHPSTPVYATNNQQMPLWHQIPAPPQGKYALPSYSPPDPSSPFTFTNTLFEDEDECGSSFVEETPKKRGALKKTRRDSNGELPSPTSVKSCSASVHSTDSAVSLPDSPSKLDSAKRQWDLLSLRVSLRVFHAKQNLSNGLHLRGISSPPHN